MTAPRIYAPLTQDMYDLLFSPEDKARLASLGELTVEAVGSTEALAKKVDGVDIVVTGWSSPALPIAECLAAGVKMVAHSAGSIKHIAPRELVDNGVALSQSAAAMAPAVAEMSLTLCLALLRHIHLHDRVLQTTRDWRAAKKPGLGLALKDRRIGVVGASRAGVEYIQMVRGLRAEDVSVYDPYLSEERAAELGVRRRDLNELFAYCDVIAVHAPTTPETKHLIGAEQLALLADDSVIVNTARSWVTDQDALLTELRKGRLRAGLDVFDVEPLAADSGFYDLPNVIVIPHEAGATVEARFLQGRIAVDEVERFVHGEPLQHAVTSENYDRLA